MPRKPKLAGKKNLPKGKKRMQNRRKPKVARAGQLTHYNGNMAQQIRASKTSLNVATYVGTAAGGTVNTIINPLLTGMPDLPYYQSLFAYYKIRSVRYTFKWFDTDSSASSTSTLNNVVQPKLYICKNYDGNLTNANNLVEKKGVVAFTFTPEQTEFQFTVYPHTLSPVYYSNTASGYKKNPQCWIDCDYVSVPHYGVLLYIDSIPLGTAISRTENWTVDFKEAD